MHSKTPVTEKYEEIRAILETVHLYGHRPLSKQFLAYNRKELDEADQDFLLRWLRDFRDREVANFLRNTRLVPESQWTHYRNHGIKGLAEQNIIRESIRNMLLIWKLRPRGLIKDYNEKEHIIHKETKKGRK